MSHSIGFCSTGTPLNLESTVSGNSIATGYESTPEGTLLQTGNIETSGAAFTGIQTGSLNTGIASSNQAATSLAAPAPETGVRWSSSSRPRDA